MSPCDNPGCVRPCPSVFFLNANPARPPADTPTPRPGPPPCGALRRPGAPWVSPGVRSPRASPRLSPSVARTCLPVVPRASVRWSSSVSFGFLPLGYVYIIARPASLCNPRGDYFLNYFQRDILSNAERSLVIPHLSVIEPQPSETWVNSPLVSSAIKVE